MACDSPLYGVFCHESFGSACSPRLYFLRGNEVSEVLKNKRPGEQLFWRGLSVVTIPCGQCMGCRLEYARQWASRCYLESIKYKYNWHLCLTYDDEHLPKVLGKDGLFRATLDKRDLQLFNKVLRERLRTAFYSLPVVERLKVDKPVYRFYAAGEYGDLRERPHYHLIAFGLDLKALGLYDFLPSRKSKCGYQMYRSEFLNDCWKRGDVQISEVNYDLMAYVARYCTKKLTGEAKSWYNDRGIQQEFSLMSRRPGIGREYYEQNKDHIYDFDSVTISKGGVPLVLKPPKYYDRLFINDDFDTFSSVQINRQDNRRTEYDTNLTAEAYAQVVAGNRDSRMKLLSRSDF